MLSVFLVRTREERKSVAYVMEKYRMTIDRKESSSQHNKQRQKTEASKKNQMN
jgi:hypothetical protein